MTDGARKLPLMAKEMRVYLKPSALIYSSHNWGDILGYQETSSSAKHKNADQR